MLEALRAAGVDYVILTLLGGVAQLRRFARDIMPAFAGKPAQPAAKHASEPGPGLSANCRRLGPCQRHIPLRR